MSTKKTIESAPSKTAMFAAIYRTIAHKDAPRGRSGRTDDLAESFLPAALRLALKLGFVRKSVREKSDRLMPGLYEFVVARTEFMDEQYLEALNDGVEQIVLLGAGYDSRAYRLSKGESGVRVFELDAGETMRRKRACLARADREVPESVVFAPIDFDRESLSDVLTQAGYSSDRSTLFIWEGVSYYLTPAAVGDVLDLVSRNRHSRSRVAFDYAVPLDERSLDRLYGARAFVETWKKRRSGEPFVFAVEKGALSALLEERGLELLEHRDSEEIEGRDGQDRRGRVTGFFRLAVAGRRRSDGRPVGEER